MITLKQGKFRGAGYYLCTSEIYYYLNDHLGTPQERSTAKDRLPGARRTAPTAIWR
jgi:hypothetical protein